MRHLHSWIIAALLLVPMAASGTDAPLEPGGTYLDDDGTVHEGAIEAITAAGLTTGCDDGRFCPDAPVTRGQMAAFINRATGLPASDEADFVDVGDSAFASDIAALASAGITTGCNPPADDRFCPDLPVTRGQMAAFITRAFDLRSPTTSDTFLDDDDSVFESDIEAVADAGVTVGCNPPVNDRYCPGDVVTRGQMASFLARALNLDPIVPEPRTILEVIGRDAWGAAAPTGSFTPHTIERLTVHHAASSLVVTGPVQFRSWQAYHQSLGWPDIAYHHIVGRDGRLYEGRPVWAVGDTATTYDPTGHYLIVVEGNFDDHDPTAEQIETLARTLAWAAVTFDVDPDSITGHRDHAATTCPGDSLYRFIADGSLSRRVEELIATGGVTLIGSHP